MDFRVIAATPNASVVENFTARQHVDTALQKGGSKACKAITDYLTTIDAKFDIFILPQHIQNGSMNSISDSGGQTGNDASRCYQQAGRQWLERPTIFWNPSCSVRIYSEVKGVKDIGLVDFARMNTRDIPRGQGTQTLVYRKLNPGNRFAPHTDKVVILASEVTLDPWMVLFHELGHMKQYFTLAQSMNVKAHDPALETAWGAKAFTPASCEPENLELHENPITEFHCAGQVRKRYYHDGFHFGAQTGHPGWQGGNLNYTQDLTQTFDNFIFSSLGKQANFYKMAERLPKQPPAGAGYYWAS